MSESESEVVVDARRFFCGFRDLPRRRKVGAAGCSERKFSIVRRNERVYEGGRRGAMETEADFTTCKEMG